MATNAETNIDGQTVKLTDTYKINLLTQIKQKIDEGYIPLGGFDTIITQSSTQQPEGYENEYEYHSLMVTTPGSTTYTQLMYKPSKPVSGGSNYKKKTKTQKRKY